LSADQRKFLTTAEVSRRLGISVSSLERMRRVGEGPPFVRIGSRRIMYNANTLAGWEQRLEGESASSAEAEQ